MELAIVWYQIIPGRFAHLFKHIIIFLLHLPQGAQDDSTPLQYPYNNPGRQAMVSNLRHGLRSPSKFGNLNPSDPDSNALF